MIENLPFTLDTGFGGLAKVGLLVLASDYTIEHEFRDLFTVAEPVGDIDYFSARIENSPTITPQTLAAMEEKIAASLRLILPGDKLDVVAYACTSASVVMGEQAIFSKIHEVHPGALCTTPVTAAMAAFDAFEARSIAVLTPYRRDVNERVQEYLSRRGYNISVFGSFNEEQDPIVSRIDLDSLETSVDTLLEGRDIDMVFVSCTSIRLAASVVALERKWGLPVTSSNHAMAWHCLRLGGNLKPLPSLGRLFSEQVV